MTTTRFPVFANADAAFRARLARTLIEKMIDRQTHNELFELYVGSLTAFGDETKAIVEHAIAERTITSHDLG